jgi:hypothetical protein
VNLYDSVDATQIPRDAPAVAGYGDGAFIWSPSWRDGSNWWDLFPSAAQLVIVVNAAHQGDVLDIERFDAAPADAPGWADRFARPGRRRPTLYHSRDLRDQVLAAMAGRPYDWWAATLDGTQDVPGAVAVQYLNTPGYDLSVVHDLSWIGGVPMFTPDEKLALVHRWYVTYLGRLPESEAAMDSWAARLADDRSNVREVQDAFATTPEAQAWLATLQNVRAQGGMPSSKDVALRTYLAQVPQ